MKSGKDLGKRKQDERRWQYKSSTGFRTVDISINWLLELAKTWCQSMVSGEKRFPWCQSMVSGEKRFPCFTHHSHIDVLLVLLVWAQ